MKHWLEAETDDRLPPLAWVASIRDDVGRVRVRCGNRVETAGDWLCEAVWAGRFAEGDLDRTPLIFGSGIRIRDRGVVFVSASTTVDRLWIWREESGGHRSVSNSLISLLSGVGARPIAGYEYYEEDLESVVDGLDAYRREIPVTRGRLRVVYFDNLIWDGSTVSKVRKPEIEGSFCTFDDYRGFLSITGQRLAENASSVSRENPVRLLTSVSKGYDSPAVSVIAREMGCRKAVTIKQARSLIPRSDSGRAIGEALGLDISVHDRNPGISRDELRFWAAMAKPQDINLGIFNYPGPVCLFLTGFHGDKVWTTQEHDTTNQIVRGDTTGLGFTEDRLHRGVLHCPLPYWGVRKVDQIAQITHSENMEPWRLHNDYDRPIPRRIVENAGVDRQAFGQRKSATSSGSRLFPYSRELRKDFAEYVEARGKSVRPIEWRHLQARCDRFLHSLRAKWPVTEPYLPTLSPDVPSVQFQWAVERLLSGR